MIMINYIYIHTRVHVYVDKTLQLAYNGIQLENT